MIAKLSVLFKKQATILKRQIYRDDRRGVSLQLWLVSNLIALFKQADARNFSPTKGVSRFQREGSRHEEQYILSVLFSVGTIKDSSVI